MVFAEVIGDPVAQSKSPRIHKHWLERLGTEGDYLKSLVPPEELGRFLARRRRDPHWRGCNVTIPHKEKILPLLDRVDGPAKSIGAINCIVPKDSGLIGFNTDVDGVAAALDATDIRAQKVAVIGAGGAARALVHYLGCRQSARITLLVRDPGRVAGKFQAEVLALDRANEGFAGAAVIINASPLGMAGGTAMPSFLLEAVTRHAEGTTLFDMVTTPSVTPFLEAGRTLAARLVDGPTMLIGQARRAFELFFGQAAPRPDQQLRDLLVT